MIFSDLQDTEGLIGNRIAVRKFFAPRVPRKKRNSSGRIAFVEQMPVHVQEGEVFKPIECVKEEGFPPMDRPIYIPIYISIKIH
jgi:hypothetical protein